MRKVVVGLIVVLLLGAGGYLSFSNWAHQAVAREVDAVLDGWRASVGSATRGRIELDLWTRSVRITDVVIQARSAPHPKITIGQIVASGFGSSGKHATVELLDLVVTDTEPGRPGSELVQTAPRVVLTAFSARPPAPGKVASALEGARLRLEQFSTITADKIEVPSLITVVTQKASGRSWGPSYSQQTYTNLVLENVREGKVAKVTTDGIAFNSNVGPPFYVLKGEVGKSIILDMDVAPMLAFLDPSRSSKAEGYQRVYRQISMGPWSLRVGVDRRSGLTVRTDGIVADEVGLNPGKLSLDDLLFLTEVTGPAGTRGAMPLQPGQLVMLMDKMAGLYEGISVGRLDILGLDIAGQRERLKLARFRIDRLENGRLAELSFDGLDAKPPFNDPATFGRVALKGFHLANFMRVVGMAATAPPGTRPSFDRLSGMQNLLEGFELKGVEVPDANTRRKIRIDASASSGKVVGTVPIEARGSFKVSIPLREPAPAPISMLVAAGFTTLAAEADVGVRWSETTGALTLEPAALEVAGVMALSVRASLGKVSRDVFAADVAKAMEAVLAVDVGPIEVTLRDLGMVDVLAADAARLAGQGPEAGRGLLLESWRRHAEAQIQLHPSAQPFFDAVGRFLQGKGETLTVRLTPRGLVRLVSLVEAFRLAPDGALLAAFTIEASSAK